MAEIQEKVTELAESLSVPHGVLVYDVEIAGSMHRPLIRVYIDKDQGITLDECERFSRALSALLDVDDPIPTSYVIEVSSPGLDRKLKKLKHYEQSKGKIARIVLKGQAGEKNVHVGRIMDVQGESICLKTEDAEEVRIPFDKISKARLEIELK